MQFNIKPAGVKHNLVLTSVLFALLMGGASFANDRLAELEMKVLGKKYLKEPMETRVERLETALHQPPHPKQSSINWRLARLHGTQHVQVAPEIQQKAVIAYNMGVDEAVKGNFEKAAELYREAIRLNPGMIEAYNNLGNLLEQIHKYPEAIHVYKTALQQIPNQPLLHRNLGVVYERIGNIPEAMSEYKRYLSLATQPDPKIKAMIENIEQQHQREQNSQDYVSVARSGSGGEMLLWSRHLNPIPVYIQFEPDQTPFLPALREAFAQWQEASDQRLRFKEVGYPEEGRIRIQLKEGPLAHPDMQVGFAKFDVEEDATGARQNLRVSISVNTGQRKAPIPLDERLEQVKRLALHEIGHALGIWGHSADPMDIMFSHPIVSQLSQRDIHTIRRLYEDASAALPHMQRRR